MLNLSLKELKLIVKNRDIKDIKVMSKDKLLSMRNTPEPINENKPIKDIRKENFDNDKILGDGWPLLWINKLNTPINQ